MEAKDTAPMWTPEWKSVKVREKRVRRVTNHDHTPMWTPMKVGEMTRYYRDGAGQYSLRRVMDPAPAGKPQRRKWVLYSGEKRIWDVQPEGKIKAAVEAVEDWLRG